MARKTKKRRKKSSSNGDGGIRPPQEPHAQLPSERQMLFCVLAFGLVVVIGMVSLAVFLYDDELPTKFQRKYHVVDVIEKDDVSSGTGVVFDYRVRLDRGPNQYKSIRYIEWAFSDVDVALVNQNQSQACIVSLGKNRGLQLVPWQRCAPM